MNNYTITIATIFGGVMRNVLPYALALTAICASCKVGPDYRAPDLNPPDAYKSAPAGEPTQTDLARDWWLLFNDPELTALIEQALAGNHDLHAAMARVTQSRAAAASVKSSFYPVISMTPSATRSRTPGRDVSTQSDLEKAQTTLGQITSIARQISALQQGTATGATATGTTATANTTISASTDNSFQVPFDFSYEIDMWGKLYKNSEAARAQYQASVFDLEVVRQTLLADLAQNYFNLRSLDAQEHIIERNLGLYREQVDLTQNKYQAGLIGETDLLQARVQVEATRAQQLDNRRQRTDLEHAIAILLGKAPAEFALDIAPLDATPPLIPTGAPADLLRRRPDLAEAEQNLIAACADIGVAKADFFPTISLTGSAGLQSAELDDVFNWKNRAWSFGPKISIPIFKGGQLRANLEEAQARYDELDATYRQNVLSAFTDVESAMTDLTFRAQASDAHNNAVAAATEYLRLTQLQYDSGVVDYLNVVNAEQTLMTNELNEAQTMNERMVSTVLLIKALGGGWDSQPAIP